MQTRPDHSDIEVEAGEQFGITERRAARRHAVEPDPPASAEPIIIDATVWNSSSLLMPMELPEGEDVPELCTRPKLRREFGEQRREQHHHHHRDQRADEGRRERRRERVPARSCWASG